MRHHPDHGGDPEKFHEVRQAYNLLKVCEYCHGTQIVEIRSGACIKREPCSCKGAKK